MRRRTFLQFGLGAALSSTLDAAFQGDNLDAAAEVLHQAVAKKQVHAATLFVSQGEQQFARSFGAADSLDSIFLLASITKPISAAAIMTLVDQGEFQLDDPVHKFIPVFRGAPREQVTLRQLLSHTCGLPDQLPENKTLGAGHAKLSEFVQGAVRTPLLFEPGSRYSYSSMGILLASEVAQRITGLPFPQFVDQVILRPLEMQHAALGLGSLDLRKTMRCQVELAAPEAGAGDPAAAKWDWNSRYWRTLGAPWGGAHGSAPDVAKFLAEFLQPSGTTVKPATARLMLQNQNGPGIRPRGLGFDIGARVGGSGCSAQTFGHGGSTGTLAWADPKSHTICVVLSTLPAAAVNPHPRMLVSDRVAQAVS